MVGTGTARANIAATVENPEGMQKGDWARRYKDQTVRRYPLISGIVFLGLELMFNFRSSNNTAPSSTPTPTA